MNESTVKFNELKVGDKFRFPESTRTVETVFLASEHVVGIANIRRSIFVTLSGLMASSEVVKIN